MTDIIGGLLTFLAGFSCAHLVSRIATDVLRRRRQEKERIGFRRPDGRGKDGA